MDDRVRKALPAVVASVLGSTMFSIATGEFLWAVGATAVSIVLLVIAWRKNR